MLECECQKTLQEMCQRVIDETGKAFKGFITERDKWHQYDGHIIRRIFRARISDPIRDACRYFWHSEKMLTAYIRKKYGDLPNAMRQTKTFGTLFETFLDDFAKERNRFMDKTTELLNIKAGELKRQGKLPQSHGGVANLLKVLTATMRQQGSSIKTIAKVQYTVCIQAGIYIPEEFITDILVAGNIERGDMVV